MMMRALSLSLLLLLVRSAMGQEPSTKARSRNDEVGVDVTYFIRQFTNLNTGGSGSGMFILDPYLITYRHYFTSCNLRAGLGGSRFVRDGNTQYQQYVLRTEQTTVDARIGMEWRGELTRKWQVYYGGDVRYGLYRRIEDPAFFNGGYAQSRWSTTDRVGLAALIGLRFKMGDRLSLTTESSLAYVVANTETRVRETPVLDGLETIEDVQTSERTESVEISVPVSIVLTVTL